MEMIATIVCWVLLPVLAILALILICIRECLDTEKSTQISEEKMRRKYIRENRAIFGVCEKESTPIGSQQEIFVVSPKELGIRDESGRRWD